MTTPAHAHPSPATASSPVQADGVELGGLCTHQDWRSLFAYDLVEAMEPQRFLVSRAETSRVLHDERCLHGDGVCTASAITSLTTRQFLDWQPDSATSLLRPCPQAGPALRCFLLTVHGLILAEHARLQGTTLDAPGHMELLGQVGALPGPGWRDVGGAVLHRMRELAPHAGEAGLRVLAHLESKVAEHLAAVREDGFFTAATSGPDPHWVAERHDWLNKPSNGWAGDWQRSGLLLDVPLHAAYGPTGREWMVWAVSADAAAALAKDSAAHDLGPVDSVSLDALRVAFEAAADADWDQVPTLVHAAHAAVDTP